ncbi:MAG: calcium/sodium antiporter [Brevinematales bacterium]|nr:calcium/sodium antiporter [Brevinematales bacterium]
MDFILLIIGFGLLIYGANFLVDGGAALAKKLNVPTIVIGLTIVAFGTSAPELIVNIFASLKNNSDIVLGNILGSNIFNILSILGISAIIRNLKVSKTTTIIEVPIVILSSIIIFIMANDTLIDNRAYSEISKADGFILLIFFILFLAYNIFLGITRDFELEEEIKDLKIQTSLMYIIVGLVFLVFGGRFVVNSSINIAKFLGISERVIGLTIVAIGTSLPELITSIVASVKKATDIAIGNVLGSNIFNVLFIIGVSSIISNVSVKPINQYDIAINMIASALIFLFLFTGKRHQIERWEGIMFIIFQIIYFVSLFIIA